MRLCILVLLVLASACASSTQQVAVVPELPVPTSDVTATPGPPAAAPSPLAVIDDSLLTESWGCGYLFAASDVAQTVAVVVQADIDLAEAGDLPPGDVTLGPTTTSWTGVVQVGEDLFANWCDDVIEPGEPERALHDEWPIVSGVLSTTCVVDDGVGECLAGATLRSGVALRDDGSEIAVGLLDLRNECWGCFAG